jgi:hypothetical protein
MLTGGSGNGPAVFYDWGKIREAASDLSGVLDAFKSDIETLYGDVKALNTNGYWFGPSYEAFKKNCDEYKTKTIDPLIQKIANWVTKLEALANEAVGTSKANTSLFS